MIPSSTSLALVSSALVLFSAAAQDCGDPDPVDIPTPPPGAEDLNMSAEDFNCITDGVKVRQLYLRNDVGYEAEAVAVANAPEGGRYPVGTIIQLIPTEAMVKRFEGFSPETNDWEYFLLDVDAAGTTVLERGADPLVGPTGVANPAGTCHGCHAQAEPQWDLICEEGHGCPPLPFPDSVINALQQGDPRCN